VSCIVTTNHAPDAGQRLGEARDPILREQLLLLEATDLDLLRRGQCAAPFEELYCFIEPAVLGGQFIEESLLRELGRGAHASSSNIHLYDKPWISLRQRAKHGTCRKELVRLAAKQSGRGGCDVA
jgi:hypothetical protein